MSSDADAPRPSLEAQIEQLQERVNDEASFLFDQWPRSFIGDPDKYYPQGKVMEVCKALILRRLEAEARAARLSETLKTVRDAAAQSDSVFAVEVQRLLREAGP